MNTRKDRLAFRVARYGLPLILLAAGLPLALRALAQETWRLDGDRVAIYNLAGEVEVVRGNGSDVEVEINRGGADRDRLQVEVDRIDGSEALRVIYPDDRVVYERMGRSSATVRVRDDGTFFRNRSLGGLLRGDEVRISGRGRGLEAHADIVVRVPAGVAVAVYQAAGSGHAAGLASDLMFRTASGAMEVAGVVGDVEVDTGSGSVAISDVEGDVTADTGSGSIGLENIRGDRLEADTAREGCGGATCRSANCWWTRARGAYASTASARRTSNATPGAEPCTSRCSRTWTAWSWTPVRAGFRWKCQATSEPGWSSTRAAAESASTFPTGSSRPPGGPIFAAPWATGTDPW